MIHDMASPKISAWYGCSSRRKSRRSQYVESNAHSARTPAYAIAIGNSRIHPALPVVR